jgi:hypothetical protein
MPHKGIIVNKEEKSIYMKPAKTAGTSVLRHFLEPEIGGFINIKDNKVEFLNWLNDITDEDLKGYYIFATVRNPYTRFSSLASYFGHTVENLCKSFEDVCKDEIFREHSHPLSMYTHVNGVCFVDQICRVENLSCDFSNVISALNIKTTKSIPVVNTSKNNGIDDFKTPESIRFVNEFYGRDFELLNYNKINEAQ